MNLAIIGATGNVGRKTIEILENSKIPFDSLFLVASSTNAGKKLSFRASEIIITFKNKPYNIFSKFSSDNEDNPNRLIIRVQPEEGLKLELTSKAPGPGGMRFFPSELNLSFGDTFSSRLPDAYERLLMDVVRGNQTLFMRSDEVLAAWDYIDPIIDIIKNIEPQLYRTGTMGPGDKILCLDGKQWIDPKENKK